MSKKVASATMLHLVALLLAVFLTAQPPASAETLPLVRTFPAPGGNIQGLAFGGGTLFAVNRDSPGSSTIFKLNPNDGSIIGSFNDPTLATGFAHDGTKLWTTRDTGSSNFIHRIDPASGTVELTIPIPVTGGTGGLAFLGGSLWVVGAFGVHGVEILQIDPTDGALLSHFDVDALGIDPRELDANGTNLLYATWVTGLPVSNFTLFTLTPTGTLIHSYILFSGDPDDPISPDIDGLASDGINVYVADCDTNTISVFDVHACILDIAITSVSTFKTIVGVGYPISINATVENQGDYTENFDITLYANTTLITTYTDITLSSGNSITITFPWDTTSVAKGNWTIKATATTLPGETDLADNTLTDGWVLVTIPGDINGDRMVRIDDVLAVALAFGTDYGGPPNSNGYYYEPELDITNDLKIRIDDALIAALHFGEGPWTA